MANLSVPKVLWGLIYLAVPAFLILCPDMVMEYIPEDFQSFFVPAVIGLIALIGLFFVRASKKTPITIIMVILILAALALVVYSNWGIYSDRMDLVHANYQLNAGEYYDKESTEFQAKVGQVIPLIIDSVKDIATFVWIAIGVPILLLGALGLKDVIAFAAIPKSKNKTVYSDKDIPENLQAQTNRPTEAQRAAKLEALKAASATSKPAETPLQNTVAPDDKPIVQPISPSFQTTAPKSGVITPSWESGDGNGEPIIKVNNTPAPEKTIASPFTLPTETPAAPVQPAAPAQPASFAPTSPFVAAAPAQPVQPVTPVQTVQPIQTAPAAPVVPETPVAPTAPVFVPETPAAPVTPVVPVAPVVPETPVAPVAPATPAPAPAPAAEPVNPFANVASPFGQAPAEEKPAEKQPEPKSEEPVNPFASFNPFGQSQPAEEKPAAPAPTPVVEKPVEEKPAKVVLTPQTPIMPTATVTPAQTRTTARAAAPTKDQISDAEKNRIKELQQQVSELKTLYNQGMITQDEYITQRTALLQQMYSK